MKIFDSKIISVRNFILIKSFTRRKVVFLLRKLKILNEENFLKQQGTEVMSFVEKQNFLQCRPIKFLEKKVNVGNFLKCFTS